MSVTAGNPSNTAIPGKPKMQFNRLTLDDPWRWVSAGWRDMWAMPTVSLAYGAFFSLISLTLTATLFVAEWSSVVLALGAGFMLIGPMMAVGLYEASRRLEAGQPVSLRDVLFVETASPTQLAFLGGLLMLVMLAWMRIASLLFALFFGLDGFPPIVDFLPTIMFTSHGLGLAVVGTAVGALIAFLVFAVSALSVPLLLERDMDAITAILSSVQCVRENIGPMVLWAWIIALVMSVGMATLFLGMVVAFPLIGHATWHAYRACIKS
jgi:uncharacterized membrane protein